jgi:hypothetical protein
MDGGHCRSMEKTLHNKLELEKLEELRLLDPKRFFEILKAHGCCSIGDQDLL